MGDYLTFVDTLAIFYSQQQEFQFQWGKHTPTKNVVQGEKIRLYLLQEHLKNGKNVIFLVFF